MSSPTRIDVMGALVSCLGHAAVLGGLHMASSNAAPHSRPSPEPRIAMVVDLVPLDGMGESTRSTTGLHSGTAPPPFGREARQKPSTATAFGAPAKAIAQAAPSTSDPAATASEDGGGIAAATAAADLDEYQRRLYETVARHSSYPSAAKKLRLAGVTYLAFRLDRRGNVLDSWVQRSSGSEMLDNAALAALDRAQPLPPIPSSLPARMDFVIEIDSSLQQVALLGAN